jgi:hypothetical protein
MHRRTSIDHGSDRGSDKVSREACRFTLCGPRARFALAMFPPPWQGPKFGTSGSFDLQAFAKSISGYIGKPPAQPVNIMSFTPRTFSPFSAIVPAIMGTITGWKITEVCAIVPGDLTGVAPRWNRDQHASCLWFVYFTSSSALHDFIVVWGDYMSREVSCV